MTEFVDYIEKREKITTLRIVATRADQVVSGALLAAEAVRYRYPWIKASVDTLPLSDVTNEDENYVFMEELVNVIKSIKSSDAERIYLCLAGGRKEMAVAAVLVAQIMGLNAVYHVLSHNIRKANVELERIRDKIKELASSKDPGEYYARNAELFEKVMYPSPDTYNVIKIPILPYPRETLDTLRNIMSNEAPQERALSRELLDKLVEAGIVTRCCGKILVTEEGLRFYRHVLEHV